MPTTSFTRHCPFPPSFTLPVPSPALVYLPRAVASPCSRHCTLVYHLRLTHAVSRPRSLNPRRFFTHKPLDALIHLPASSRQSAHAHALCSLPHARVLSIAFLAVFRARALGIAVPTAVHACRPAPMLAIAIPTAFCTRALGIAISTAALLGRAHTLGAAIDPEIRSRTLSAAIPAAHSTHAHATLPHTNSLLPSRPLGVPPARAAAGLRAPPRSHLYALPPSRLLAPSHPLALPPSLLHTPSHLLALPPSSLLVPPPFHLHAPPPPLSPLRATVRHARAATVPPACTAAVPPACTAAVPPARAATVLPACAAAISPLAGPWYRYNELCALILQVVRKSIEHCVQGREMYCALTLHDVLIGTTISILRSKSKIKLALPADTVLAVYDQNSAFNEAHFMVPKM
ncbi:hypothetical protein GGX14DRAFT_387552 [Mycena pura]|uniref:Uncharacterized protein n=1 Tax=Mycena pura TaxID=153505 RepID=A0AAD6YM22_9AGAR|nr:hypothetical protein GGX14DRAFT_387552 [Mycena pura]